MIGRNSVAVVLGQPLKGAASVPKFASKEWTIYLECHERIYIILGLFCLFILFCESRVGMGF